MQMVRLMIQLVAGFEVCDLADSAHQFLSSRLVPYVAQQELTRYSDCQS